MPLKNTIQFTQFNTEKIQPFLYKKRLPIAVLGALILFLSSCKKEVTNDGTYTPSVIESYFANTILNKNFIITLASDNSIDLTAQYAGYSFILSKTTSYYNGPISAIIGTTIYTGTWSSNSDYSKLIIDLTSPSIPTEFIFLNRSWKFTKKAIPTLELAPWGSTDPKVLHMQRL